MTQTFVRSYKLLSVKSCPVENCLHISYACGHEHTLIFSFRYVLKDIASDYATGTTFKPAYEFNHSVSKEKKDTQGLAYAPNVNGNNIYAVNVLGMRVVAI